MKRGLSALCVAGAALALGACGGGGATTGTGSETTAGESALQLRNAEVRATGQVGETAPGTRHVVTVKLRPGIRWSDGSAFTSRDFAGHYEVLWAQQDPIWTSLTDIRTPDDETLVFETRELSPNILRLLLRWNQTAARSQFGPVYDRLARLHDGGARADSAPVAAALAELERLKLKETVAYGPYAIDPKTVTAQQLELRKNPGGYNASEIDFGKVVVYWGATQQTVPLLLSNQLDYTTDVLTPADQRAVAGRQEIELIKTPLGTGTGIWFNESIRPFDRKEFRQAVAHVVDRARNAKIALGEAARPIEQMAGFSDNLTDSWLDDETRAALNGYELDTAKATELLESIGMRRVDGRWRTADGEPLAFEITAPTDFPDFMSSAKDVSEQLNDFGFETKVRGIAAATRPDAIRQGRYEALLDFSLVSTPSHPHTSLDWNMAAGFFGSNNPEARGAESKGLNWPWRQTTADGEQVYVPDLLAQSVRGLDERPQREAVAQLAQIFNDQLPVVPIFERYTTDPIAHGPRVEGWLPADHPVYANNQGSDNYVSQQLLAGQLRPKAGGDGTFRTSAPYLQPPNNSFSYYAANSLEISFTALAYDASFPPLFWYSEADKHYVPAVAEAYSIQDVG